MAAVVPRRGERYDSRARFHLQSRPGVVLPRFRPTTVAGTHRVPGDKSITHRALMLGAFAPGRSRILGALTSEDARASARAMRQLGARVSPLRSGAPVEIVGHRRLTAPARPINCANSGTTARLLLGLLATQRITVTLTGDESLRRRPMRRVTEPLQLMGASVVAGANDGLPLTITGGRLRPLEWRLPVASAQIKSALLLAGALGRVEVRLHEPAASRDHTERMLRHFGFDVDSREGGVILTPTGTITPFEIDVPGDPSSAIFLLAAAALAGEGVVAIDGVGINPSRIGYLSILARLGVHVGLSPRDESFGEPRGTLTAAASALDAIDVMEHEVPAVIDEIPMLACLAARAQGTSEFRGLAELRVKESDRLALLALNLRAVGVSATVEGDNLRVIGTDKPLHGRVTTRGDHRIAMAFAVLGTQSGSRIVVDNMACAAVSFPGFDRALASLFVKAA